MSNRSVKDCSVVIPSLAKFDKVFASFLNL
jgi:hypothetical protein